MLFFQKFQRYPEIIHGIMERSDGSVNPFPEKRSINNILGALKGLGYQATSDNLFFAEQTHGANAFLCSSGAPGGIKPNVDGLVSGNSGQVLVIKTADCLPILFYHPRHKIVAAVHAGREGLIAGIIEKTLEILAVDHQELVVGLGPHIRQCCYYLRNENCGYARTPEWKKYARESADRRFYFDLTNIALDKIRGAGIREENIEDCGICTFCQAERFFSARKKEQDPNFYQQSKGNFPCFGSFIGLK